MLNKQLTEVLLDNLEYVAAANSVGKIWQPPWDYGSLVPLNAQEWPSGKQRLANKLLTLSLCLQQQIANSWTLFNLGVTPLCYTPIAAMPLAFNHETASGVRREKRKSVKRQDMKATLGGSYFILKTTSLELITSNSKLILIIENAESRIPYGMVFIRYTACFHCDLMNYESQFIESQWKHAVSCMKMLAVRDSASSLLLQETWRFKGALDKYNTLFYREW